MTTALFTDEHVPSVFVTTLRSRGFDVVRARSVFGERTDDRQILRYCAEHQRILMTHDKRDFGGAVGRDIDHTGIVIYTEPQYLRDDPGTAAETLERIFGLYDRESLQNERIWFDHWRRTV